MKNRVCEKHFRTDWKKKGREEGLQDGVRVGRILLLQQILGLPESTLEQLAACDSTQLSELEDKLQQQLRLRQQP
jgi:hypothetical protein